MLFALALLAAPADPGPPFPRIANCYGVGLKPDSTPQDLAEIARCDLLIGGVWCNWAEPEQRRRLAGHLAELKRLNPHLIVLDFSSSAPYHYPNDTRFPAGGWLLQPDGKRVLGWPGTAMINLRRPDVLGFLTARSVESVKDKCFDGSFIDCMGSSFDWWACNIERGEAYQIDADGDGKPDDRKQLDEQWIEAKTQLSRQVRAALGDDGLFMTNQAGYWGLPDMNGILLEDYLDYVLAGQWDFERVMDEYFRWTAAPRRPNLTTIVSSSALEPPFDPWKSMPEPDRNALLERGRTRLDRMRFGLAATLMGDGYYAYDLHTRWRGQRWWYPEYDAPLGYPKSPGAPQPDGTWRREFDGGTVIVNPTPLDQRVGFPGRHRDVSAGKVARELVVPALDGRIFLPTNAAETPGQVPDPVPLFTAAGPETVLERDGRVLVRFRGGAALCDSDGRVQMVTDGGKELARGLTTFVAQTPWRDFAYQDQRHELLPDGVQFHCRRSEGEVVLDCTEEVRA
ncbi:MAG: hypothetical protein HYU66_15095, partial [Armatimonadetes bacterium]|nr:hypothetical protein [Armatimonadota bacterium]